VPETLAANVIDPPAVGVTTMVAVSKPDEGIDVQLQVTVLPEWVQVPLFVAEDETNVEFAGSVFVSTVFVPCDVLAL
jgi:hypothetical protein